MTGMIVTLQLAVIIGLLTSLAIRAEKAVRHLASIDKKLRGTNEGA